MAKILLVEDEELERIFLRSLIEKNAAQHLVVGEAANGREAIALSKQLSPDIIFMDIKMPGIDGLNATKKIKEFNPHIKIIIISAYDDFCYAQQAMRLGANEYLLKPAQPDEILSAINRVVEIKNIDPVNLNATFANDSKEAFISSNYPFRQEKTLIRALQQHDSKLFTTAMSEYIKQLLQSCQTLSIIKFRLFELITLLSRTLNDCGFEQLEIRRLKLRNFERISKITNLNEVQSFFEVMQQDFVAFTITNDEHGQALVQKILSYINSNLTKNISLDDIAQHFHFSTCHLSRLIKKETGLTFPEYLNQLRLAEAKILLRNSNLPIQKIAHSVGYNEISHFNRVFKKALGINPTKYRKIFSDENKDLNKALWTVVNH